MKLQLPSLYPIKKSGNYGDKQSKPLIAIIDVQLMFRASKSIDSFGRELRLIQQYDKNSFTSLTNIRSLSRELNMVKLIVHYRIKEGPLGPYSNVMQPHLSKRPWRKHFSLIYAWCMELKLHGCCIICKDTQSYKHW